MKFFSISVFVLLLSVNLFAVDRWGAFSDPFPIRDAIPLGDNGVLLATEGGIRYRTLDVDNVFHSEHGLETSSFYALASSNHGVFAVSEFGLIARYLPEEIRWKVLNRSYVNNNVRMVPGGAEISGGILVLAFEDRLAFYDLTKNSSILTIERIGSYELLANPIRNMVIRGDSLYVKTERAVFAREMSWNTLASDKRLSDPNSWSILPETQSVKGLEPKDKSTVKVGKKKLTNPLLFNNGTSVVQWIVEGADGYYLVGSSLIAYCPKGTTNVVDLTYYAAFAIGSTYEIINLPFGGMVAASGEGNLVSGNITGLNKPFVTFNGMGSYSTEIKTLSASPDGEVFFHVWGRVYQMYSMTPTSAKLEYGYTPYDGLCFDNYLRNFAISWNTVPAPDNSGFLTTTSSNDGYSIVYFTKEGDVRCANHVGSESVAGAMHVLVDDDGSWLIYVGSRKATNSADPGNLDVFKFPAPNENGGELANGVRKTYKIGGPVPVDMAYDSVANRLWMVSISNLYYFDKENDTLVSPTSTNGLRSPEYTSIATDVHGNLWVGTANQGVYRLTSKKSSPDTLSVLRLTTRDGLLNNDVRDLAIDPVYGVAWFAHLNGVSYYQRNDLKDARANMTDSAKVKVKAYPIPFRPKVHARFTIEGVTESSVVSIYNRGGALIRAFRNSDLLGGKLEWDGCDKSGRLVAPGVYYYVINDGSKNKKGKFLIVH